MFTESVTKSELIGATLFSLCIVFALFLNSTYRLGVARIVFCDVGQGDGVYIRTQDGTDITVDAGSGVEMLECLGRYMPFWDKKIELSFISHPQEDHYGGMIGILDHYRVERLVMTPVDSDATSFGLMKERLVRQRGGIEILYLYAGESIRVGEYASVHMLWPTKEYVRGHTQKTSERPEDDKNTVLKLYTSSEDTNNFSQVFTLSIDSFDVLFTGDASPYVLARLMSVRHDRADLGDRHIEVLKVPHHGSKNGLISDFLNRVTPDLSVISVGRNNSFGHPSELVLQMLATSGSKVLQTALDHDIVIEILPQGMWRVMGQTDTS